MKKYVWLGLAVVILGVSAGLIGKSLSDSGKLSSGKELIAAQNLSLWVRNPDEVVSEIKNNQFYIQESIGSQGIVMENPQAVSGDFNLSFELLTLTRHNQLKLFLTDAGKGESCGVELKLNRDWQDAVLLAQKKALAQARGTMITPDVFYRFRLSREGEKLQFALNDDVLLQAETANCPQTGEFLLQINGQPDHPAAVEIKEMRIKP